MLDEFLPQNKTQVTVHSNFQPTSIGLSTVLALKHISWWNYAYAAV